MDNTKVLDKVLEPFLLIALIITIICMYITLFIGTARSHELIQPVYYDIEDNEEVTVETVTVDMQPIYKIKNELEWFTEYKEVVGDDFDLSNHFNEEDLEYLYRCVETECYQADFVSKSNVVRVIFNRLEDEMFPNSIKDVVTQPNQFCYFRKDISEDTKLACEYAYYFMENNDCYWFHSGQWKEKFSGGTYQYTDDVGHHFYSLTKEEEDEGENQSSI